MSNPYVGSNIAGCSSPTIGADKTTYSAMFDSAMAAIDTHDHTSNKGVQIATAGLADVSVTTAKIADAAVTAAKLATSVAGLGLTGGGGSALAVSVDDATIEINVDSIRVKAGGLNQNHLATSIAGNGLTGGAGTPLSVVVDGTTIIIATDTLQVADNGITTAKLLDANVTTSKILDANVTYAKLAPAVTSTIMPSGVILPFGGTAAPTGFLLCDGSSVLRATYPALYTAIGNAFGTADGTHFNLPDFRGRFMRGVAGGNTNDPDRAARTAMATGGNAGDNVGSVQGQATKKNGLALTDPGHAHIERTGTSPGQVGTGVGYGDWDLSSTNTSGISTATNNTGVTLGAGDNETRPLNAYVNYIIKT